MACNNKLGACVLVSFAITTVFTTATCIFLLIHVFGIQDSASVHFSLPVNEVVRYSLSPNQVVVSRETNIIGPWKTELVVADEPFCELTDFNMVVTITQSAVYSIYAQASFLTHSNGSELVIYLEQRHGRKGPIAICSIAGQPSYNRGDYSTCYVENVVHLQQDDVISIRLPVTANNTDIINLPIGLYNYFGFKKETPNFKSKESK